MTPADVGRTVVYRSPSGHEDHGVITSLSHGGWVFVRYGTDEHSKATHADQLAFVDKPRTGVA